MKQTMPFWVPILVAFIAGLFSLGGYILKAYLDRKQTKTKDVMKLYIQLYNRIHTLINEELQRLGAHQILIFKAENGGGIPTPGAEIYTSVIWEAYDPPIKGVQAQWQRVKISAAKAEVLSSLIQQGYRRYATKDLPHKSQLREFFDTEGIVASELFLLHANSTRILYAIIGYAHAIDLDCANIRLNTMMLTNQLTTTFKEMEELEKAAK